jgi:hypothetical protein
LSFVSEEGGETVICVALEIRKFLTKYTTSVGRAVESMIKVGNVNSRSGLDLPQVHHLQCLLSFNALFSLNFIDEFVFSGLEKHDMWLQLTSNATCYCKAECLQ